MLHSPVCVCGGGGGGGGWESAELATYKWYQNQISTAHDKALSTKQNCQKFEQWPSYRNLCSPYKNLENV